jgi:hypothetical protein
MSEPGGVPMFDAGRTFTKAELATCTCTMTRLEREVMESGVRLVHELSCPWAPVGMPPKGEE